MTKGEMSDAEAGRLLKRALAWVARRKIPHWRSVSIGSTCGQGGETLSIEFSVEPRGGANFSGRVAAEADALAAFEECLESLERREGASEGA